MFMSFLELNLPDEGKGSCGGSSLNRGLLSLFFSISLSFLFFFFSFLFFQTTLANVTRQSSGSSCLREGSNASLRLDRDDLCK